MSYVTCLAASKYSQIYTLVIGVAFHLVVICVWLPLISAAEAPATTRTTISLRFTMADRALLRAALRGDLKDVKKEIKGGAEINARHPKSGSTALFFAVCANSEPVVKYLLDAGADPNTGLWCGVTPLMEARQPEIVTLLLKHKAALESSDFGHWTALSHAAFAGNIETTKILLEYGADLNVKDADGNTPLQLAKKQGNANIVDFIINREKSLHDKKPPTTTPIKQ